MLKALELSGFKSFADKTRFEFPAGITVIVGPNGSGKSNIVDAIKWVLGEQSAKSLRGKDMSDIIFKGSGGRKVLNTAEATIVIDNSEGLMHIDAPEIHVTRRVYRSGEGEYLINGQPCRLKDVRDMFRGTGVGTDAYSLIEQGKVDRLLQASPKDRRAIFEEAAGISRFKAKKIETQRRLERVEQNLLRLSDIVEEVENRLRSVRAQAKKAQRYREHRDRLQQLRTQVGLADWRAISEQLEEFDQGLDQLHDESNALAARSEEIGARILSLETQNIECDESIRVAEAHFARTVEHIASRESTSAGEREICRDLDEQVVHQRHQVASLVNHAGDLEIRLEETTQELETFQAEFATAMAQATFLDESVQQLDRELDRMRSLNEARRTQYVEQMRSQAVLNSQMSSAQSQLEATEEAGQRIRLQLGEVETRLHERHRSLAQEQQSEGKLSSQEADLRGRVESGARRLNDQRRLLTRRHEEQAHLQGRLRGTNERLAVLTELEEKLQGLSAGVKQVLSLSQPAEPGATAHLAAGEILGLVADLVESKTEFAKLIDLALGERAQFVVLSGNQLSDQLIKNELQLEGRVGFLRLDQLGPHPRSPNLSGDEAVIGRADKLIEVAAEHRNLLHNLLGDTWIVTDLPNAVRLWRGGGRGCRFVTRNTELVDFDGAIVMGPQHASLGLLARRSELRDLKAHIADLESRLRDGEQELHRLQQNIDQQELDHQQSVEKYDSVQRALAESRIQINSWRDQIDQMERERQVADQELHAKHALHRVAQQETVAVQQRIEALQLELTEIEETIQSSDQLIQQQNTQRQQQQQELTTAKVEFAKREQRLEALQSQMERWQQDQMDRSSRLEDAKEGLRRCSKRSLASQRKILKITSELAELYLDKQAYVADASQARKRRQQLQTQRSELTEESDRVRKGEKKCEDRQHKLELEAERLRQQRGTLADRLRDDYGIEIEKSDDDASQEDNEQRDQVEVEIADLRRKISNIGAVNLDALAELDDLETRFTTLSTQHDDLRSAKETLVKIIQQINSDSRRLFVETLDVIRANFQVLYRKAFGGGRADILLEEGVDVLEAGVELTAQPPGKPSFNNSLLSGGEKALTAVALLLAIFEFRPSPFCVLDEVDAPFDEANIGRFIEVLNGFLGWTKFVIVTHSKKTMTAAHTLYGVTMQESGVSKQVSVRFEDVSDDGEIRPQAG